jgi:hypothetical protein
VSQPAYLTPTTDPTFGTTITRIANDPGQSLTTTNVGTGTWGTLARHVYAKIEPWNSNGTLLAIANVGGTNGPRQLYLDGSTYQVQYGKPANYFPRDDRWNPSPLHPDERIAVMTGGTTLEWYNVVTQQVTRSWTLPFAVDSIGSGEGNPSNDGRYVLLSENDPTTDAYRMFMVDMDNGRIGPAYNLATDGQMQPGWGIDWVSVSSSGKYAVVMYAYNGIDNALRVFDINPNTLALTPHSMTTTYPGMVGRPQDGFIYGLGHADLAIDPFDGNQDVIVGTENCGNVGSYVPGIHTVNGAPVGQVIMVRLSDGQATSLDDPRNEAGPAHISTRNVDRPGWAYISFYYGTKGAVGGARFADEIVALKLDGSGSVERLAYEHSDFSVGYYAYPMAVPSPDGTRVVFASNWAHDGNGVPTDYQDYVVDFRSLIDTVAPSSSVAALPEFSPATFTVSWSGSDNSGGSGLASYSIYVSDNGGAFTPLLTDTTQTSTSFTGVDGHTYGFYSIATDNVGNVQPTPTAAQATTTVQTQSPTTTTLTSDYPSGSVYGQTVTFTAAVTADNGDTPTGSVDFTDTTTGQDLGTSSLQLVNGVAQASVTLSSLTATSHVIAAAYTSDNSNAFANSRSPTLTQVVNKATPTVSVSDAGGTYNGKSFPASATAVGVDGKTAVSGSFGYAYYVGTGTSGTSLGGTAPTTAGTYTVVATFTSSDPNYTGGNAQTTFIINPATPTVSVADAGGTYNSSPFPTMATVAGVDNKPASSLEGVTLTLTYYAGSTASGTPLAGTPNSAGTYTVVAQFAGSTDYTSASAQTTFTITPANTSTALRSSANPSAVGQSVTLTASVSVLSPGAGTPTGTVTFKDGSTVLGTANLEMVNGSETAFFTTSSLAVGSHSITAVYSGDSNFVTSTSAVISQQVLNATTTCRRQARRFGASRSP